MNWYITQDNILTKHFYRSIKINAILALKFKKWHSNTQEIDEFWNHNYQMIVQSIIIFRLLHFKVIESFYL